VQLIAVYLVLGLLFFFARAGAARSPRTAGPAPGARA
jgi:hypothetical protein